jgi:hypothetical protein
MNPDRPNHLPAAHRALRDEYLEAWRTDPTSHIRTPGKSRPTQRLVDLVGEELYGDMLTEVMFIVRDGAAGQDVQLRCGVLSMQLAMKHAAFFAGELCEEMEGAS